MRNVLQHYSSFYSYHTIYLNNTPKIFSGFSLTICTFNEWVRVGNEQSSKTVLYQFPHDCSYSFAQVGV